MGALDDIRTSIFRDKDYVAPRTAPHKTRENAMSDKELKRHESNNDPKNIQYTKPTLVAISNEVGGLFCLPGSGDALRCLSGNINGGSCTAGTAGGA